MRGANLFNKAKTSTITKTEKMLLRKVISIIIANHENDYWSDVYMNIKCEVNRNLNHMLADDMLAELDQEEKEKEEQEKEEKLRKEQEEAKRLKEEKEEADKESDKILADMLEKNAKRQHELKEKIKNDEVSPNNIGEDGGPTIEYRIHSYNDYGAHGELSKSNQVEGGE